MVKSLGADAGPPVWQAVPGWKSRKGYVIRSEVHRIHPVSNDRHPQYTVKPSTPLRLPSLPLVLDLVHKHHQVENVMAGDRTKLELRENRTDEGFGLTCGFFERRIGGRIHADSLQAGTKGGSVWVMGFQLNREPGFRSS